MPEPVAVFLRGINVGGVRIKMDVLKTVFVEMGFTSVQTLLATGNVIAAPPDDHPAIPQLTARIELGLSETFGYEAHVIIRSRAQIATILAGARAVAVPDDAHLYVLLCDDQALPAELHMLFDNLPHMTQEQFTLVEHDAFWIVPKGSTLESGFGNKVLGSKKYRSRLTSRNINTVQKVHEAMLRGG
ncbi:MAG TPA: DUF1697 domain-containing protein [Candidatus Limnocylindrales bacterium]|nr:DUF1697 domain-containing protein [Candidatus Limnocylindrales bacterium]